MGDVSVCVVDRRNCDIVVVNGVAGTLISRATTSSWVRTIYCGSRRYASLDPTTFANYYKLLIPIINVSFNVYILILSELPCLILITYLSGLQKIYN